MRYLVIIFGIIFLSSPGTAFGINYFWVAPGASNWNNSANWGTVAGGPGGAGIPGVADVANFTGSFNTSCSIDAAVNVQGILISGYSGTISQNTNPITIGANGFTQSSGTFSGGSGNITINSTGVFLLSGGTFTSTNKLLTITGSRGASQTLFTHSAGTFNHNFGSVHINPNQTGCTQRTFTFDVLPATSFFNLTLNATASCGINPILTTNGADIVNTESDLSHQDGIISGLFAVQGNLVIGSGADGGTGTITANGTGLQAFDVAAGSPRTCKLVVNKSAGDFEPALGTTDLFAQAFTLTNGTFTAPSSNLNLGGTWSIDQTLFTHAGGTFNHNSGTVVINPNQSGCTQRTFTIDVIAATVFNSFQINGTQSCGLNPIITTALADVVNCNLNFTHTDGIINGQFSLQGDLIIAGGSDGGTGTITVNGTGTETYTVSAGSPRTCKLVVNKSAGVFEPAPGTTELAVQSFSLLAGDFIAPTGNLNVGGTWTTDQTLFLHSGGNFTHNNGTLLVNPNQSGCTQRTFTMDVIPATLFNSIHLNGTQSCGLNPIIATAAGDVANCINDITHTDGIINGQFELQGNLIINAGSDGGTGVITVNGTGAETYSVAGATPRTCQVVVDKSAGAFTPAFGTTDFLVQAFFLQAGDFIAPTGNLNVGGTWSTNQTLFGHSGGNFSHNNGTVLVNPNQSGCTQRTFTIDVIPATLFNSIHVNGTQSCGLNPIIATAAGDVANCLNDITHSDGIINGQFAMQGDLIINAGSDGGVGVITVNGTGAETYSVAGATPRTCQVVVDKSAGAFTPAVGTTDFLVQAFFLQAGDFTAPTGNLNVGGTWSTNQTLFGHSGGNFSHNNGTVLVNPNQSGCTQRTFTIDVIPATLFNSIHVNGTQSCGLNPIIATAAGDVANCINDITHSDGIINGQFAMQGDLIINAGSDGGVGVITVNGTGAETYSVAGATPRTCQVVVDKSAGAFTPAVGTTDFLVQAFFLQAGDFTAPSGNLNVGGTWSTNQTLFGHSGGNFSHNNGTVLVNPNQSGCTQRTYTMDVIPATNLYNLVINGTQSCGLNPIIATAAGDVVNCNNDITHTDAIISGQFAMQGNLIINSGSDGGTGTITVNGTGAETYSVAAGSPRTCQVVVNKSAGAFTPLAGTFEFLVQAFSLVAGNFTAPTGSLNVGGSWSVNQTLFTHSAGNYTHNNGTLVINPNQGGCTQRTFTIDVIAATKFFDLTINGTQSCGVNPIVATAANDTVDVINNLIYNDAVCNARIEVAGNVTVTPSHDGGTGQLIFKAQNNQTFDLTGATALFNGPVLIKKTNNKVNLASTCQLDLAGQSITFNKGILVSSSTNLLILGDNVTALSASDSSFVDGPVRKIGNDVFTFPIGKNDSIYASIAISAPSNVAHHFTAEYFNDDPDAFYDRDLKDVSLDHISQCEYWILDRTNGTSNVSVTLSWNTPRSCGVTSLPDLAVARWDGTQWKDHQNGGAGGTTVKGTIVSLGVVTSFSPFTLSSTSLANPLPVELISFTGECRNDLVEFSWTTASEINSDYFVLESSYDGVNWNFQRQINAAGNSSAMIDYSTQIEANGKYYRLAQIDFDGTVHYSSMIGTDCEGQSEISLYPNPTTGQFIINSDETILQIEITDCSGRVVFFLSGSHTIFDLSDQSAGVYYVKVANESGYTIHKLVLE